MDNATEIFCDIMPIVEKAAPVIGMLLGSPLAGTIVGLFAAIVDGNPCDPQQVAQKLKDDPDLYAKLAKLEASHEKWLQQWLQQQG